MVDTRHPFGASKSQFIFTELSQAVRRIMAEKRFPNIIVHIDDFLIVESSYKRCKKAMTTLMQVLRQLGFRINYNKVIEPTQRLIFLGVNLSRNTMVLSLPQAKCNELKALIHKFMEAGGAYHLGDAVYTPWHLYGDQLQNLPINYKEAIALEPAVQAWAPYWTNKKIYVHLDNQTAVALINRRSCRHPIVMASFRRIFWLSVQFNFRLQAVYYPGQRNMFADCVSRLHKPDGFQRLLKCIMQTNHFNHTMNLWFVCF